MSKTVSNTSAADTAAKVKDVKFFGNGDTFKLLCKAWSEEEEWMKSTKAMEIPGVGCVVQVSTQNEDLVAEAVTFVPGVKIQESYNAEGIVISRELVKF